MTRRTVASLLGMGLVVLLGLAMALVPVPYVTMQPGPTVDVLGKSGGKPIVQVEGHRTYPTDGALSLVTVLVTNPDVKMNLFGALVGWVNPSTAVLPHDAVYPPGTTSEEEEAQDSAQMVNSQDTAVAAALTQMGYDLDTYAEVTGVSPSGPSKGQLEPRDRFVSLGLSPIETVPQLFEALSGVEPGETVRGVVLRDGKRTPFAVKTVPAPDDPDRALLGIIVGTGYVFPFDVQVKIDDSIGGPSAGLVFALSVYDTLTPGPLLQGSTVAGTGTIAADGAVGPIGGIQQKIVAAHDAGATVFLVPPDNCDEAVGAPVEDDDIRLVRADTFTSALRSLEKYADNPDADLPEVPVVTDTGPTADLALRGAVLELEKHASEGGWDQPAQLFALVLTEELLAAQPELAPMLDLAPGADLTGSLTPVEQEALPPEQTLEELLTQVMWPPEVHGTAVIVERLVLPPSAGELPDDPELAQEVAATHPEREEVRMVVAATRAGSTYCALRLRSHDEDRAVIEGPDLVPVLLELLQATLASEHGPRMVDEE